MLAGKTCFAAYDSSPLISHYSLTANLPLTSRTSTTMDVVIDNAVAVGMGNFYGVSISDGGSLNLKGTADAKLRILIPDRTGSEIPAACVCKTGAR